LVVLWLISGKFLPPPRGPLGPLGARK